MKKKFRSTQQGYPQGDLRGRETEAEQEFHARDASGLCGQGGDLHGGEAQESSGIPEIRRHLLVCEQHLQEFLHDAPAEYRTPDSPSHSAVLPACADSKRGEQATVHFQQAPSRAAQAHRGVQ